MAPALLFVAVFVLIPLGQLVATSLSDRSLLGGGKFIGPNDCELITITDDPMEAVKIILDYVRRVGPPEKPRIAVCAGLRHIRLGSAQRQIQIGRIGQQRGMQRAQPRPGGVARFGNMFQHQFFVVWNERRRPRAAGAGGQQHE